MSTTRRRITITLTEEETAALEALGERCCFRQDWMGHWRAKLLHRAFTAFLELAQRERVSFPLRLEFGPPGRRLLLGVGARQRSAGRTTGDLD